MASVNVSEEDFEVCAQAAYDEHVRGRADLTRQLDKLARKINASLSNERARKAMGPISSLRGKAISWHEVPSTLERGR